jgi:branched-chain amino acid transport system ATP-binding protein
VTILSARELTKSFGGLVAVDQVSFDVHEGQIKALIGPNGAGKSTVFNLLTAFDTPDSGAVFFAGKSVSKLSATALVRSGVARTFQNTLLFESMTALENVMTGASVRLGAGFAACALRLPNAMAHERSIVDAASRFMRLLGVEEWAEKPASDLPAGVRRLVEIARALATEPRIVLLDEPAAGLNDAETAQLADALYRVRDSGVTVLLVEHHMALVMEVSDEVVVLERGRKIAEGSPRIIQKDPAVIAAYLGVERESVASIGGDGDD